MEIHEVAYHRNGICGEPFYAIRFMDDMQHEMVGIVFPPNGFPDEPLPDEFFNPRVAVLEICQLAGGVVTFGKNSWRGDEYADGLFAAIKEFSIRGGAVEVS